MTARLPVPGSDDGNWGSILNNYLLVSHAADGTISAGAVGSTQVNDAALPQAKIQNLTTDLAGKVSSSSVGSASGVAGLDSNARVPHTQLPTFGDPYYPIQEYGFFTASTGIEAAKDKSTMGGFYFARIFIPAGKAIGVAATVVTDAGTLGAGGGNCFCVYDDSGNLVASTPTDDTLWATTGWRIGTFSTPIPAQTADRFVYASPFCVGYSSAPYIPYNVVANTALLYTGYNKPNHRRAFYANAGSPPASFDPTSYGSDSNYLPFIALG